MTERKTYSCILTGLLRNFGGLESEIKFVIDTFNQHLKDFKRSDFDEARPYLLDLVHANITDCHARHLMLLTRGDSSLGIVEELLRSHRRQYMTILGSSFEEDQSDHYSYRILHKIILCMEQGTTMILKDLETVYRSLYDMLNQNYTVVGSKKNCRIALGPHSNPLCQVHEKFRCIVLVEEHKVDLADPPFLNRFEKQRLIISDILDEEMKELAKKFNRILEGLSKVSGFQAISPAELVPIFNSDMIPSLVHNEFKLMKDMKYADDIEKKCRQKILILCSPEGMVRAEKSALKTSNSVLLKSLREEYFKQPIHDGLEPYLHHIVSQFEGGVAAMIFTHSNVYTDLPHLVKDFAQNCQFEKLGAFKSEKQLTTRVKQFLSDPEQTWFFIQVSHTDQQHFLLMKSVLEQERKHHLTSETDRTAIKHVVVIIHIDRTNANSIELVNFLSGWHLAMIDNLEHQQLSLGQMLNGSLEDLSRKLLHDDGISRQELFAAFAFISYTDKSRSMESIEELVDIICENDVIKKVLHDLVNDWISTELTVMKNKDWQLDVACNMAKLKTHLTFHAALLDEVKSKLCHPLAAAVFTIENLNGWDYLTSVKGFSVSNERLERWQAFASSNHIVDITGVAEPKGVECYPCKLTTLNTKFPFSNFFIHRIETLNGVFLDIWRGKQLEAGHADIDETTCVKLHQMFRSSVKGLATELFESSCERSDIEDYFSDYCQWFAADLPLNMTADQRIDVIMQAMRSRTNVEETELDLFVTQIHVTGWIYKYKLQSEIILIDTCLSQLPISLEDILSKTYKTRDDNGRRLQDRKDEKGLERGTDHPNFKTRPNSSLHLEDMKEEIDEHAHEKLSGDERGSDSDNECDQHTVSESDVDISLENPDDLKDQRRVREDTRHVDNRDDKEMDEEETDENEEVKFDQQQGMKIRRPHFEMTNTAAADDDDEDDDDTEKDDDENDVDIIAASLVDFLCHFLIPSDQMKTKSVSEWQSMVNLVLSLTTDVSLQPAILETLRACNDLASMLILPHRIDERHFWTIGTSLFNTGLDSEVVVDVLKNFISEVKTFLEPDEIQHFLTSYASCCLMADSQSSFMFKMFDIRECINMNISDVAFLGSVFHPAMYLQYEDPEELLDEENLDNEFFTDLQAILDKSQTVREDSSFACLLIDILQNHIFKDLIKQVEDDIQGFLEKLLELKRQYVKRKPNKIMSLIVIGYLKSSLQHLTVYLRRQKHLNDNIWQKINQLFEDGSLAKSSRVHSLQAYFLRCLVDKGGLYACEKVKEDFNQCQFLSELHTGFEKDLQANEQNPWYLHCRKQYLDVRKAASEVNESKVSLHELLDSAATDSELSYAFFAFGMNKFYLVKGRNLKKLEEDLATNMVSEAKDKLPCHKLRLFSLLCQQEVFGFELFQIQNSAVEHHMVSSILDLLATLFSSVQQLDSPGGHHILVDCICNPLTTVKRPIPGLQDQDTDVHSLVMKEHRETSLFTFDCNCGCRLLFKEKDNLLQCPNCKTGISQDYSKLTDDQFEDISVTSVDETMMETDSTSGMTDIDESTTSVDMEIFSVSEHSYCAQYCEVGSMETVRDMSQTSLRIIQLMYFGCLAGGVALKYSTKVDLHSILHLDDKADPCKTLKSHLLHQWDCLKSILSMGDEQLSRFLNKVIYKSRDLLTEVKWHIESPEERNEFEHIFTERITPLVKRRFDMIAEHVKQFNETCSEKEGFLEDVLCETQDENFNKEGLPRFWRQIMQPCTENLKSEFFLTKSFKAFHVLALVFMYDKELKLMKHIWSLVQWHICTVKHISYRYKKRECEDKSLAQFIHSLEEENSKKEVKSALEKFTKAWEDITKMKGVVEMYTSDIGPLEIVHAHIELHKCIIMSPDSQVYQVLRALIMMQNRFLEEAMKVALFNEAPASSFLLRSKGCAAVPTVRVEDVAEHQVIKEPDLTDLLKFSQCNTQSAHGQEVVYDYYQIERDVALQCLMKKTHIVLCDSFPKIKFSGEIVHTASTLLREIAKLVPQDLLGPETEHQLGRMDPANRKVLMNYLEMTFFLIKRTSVSSSDRKLNLGDFLEKWQYIFHNRVSDVDDFCSNVCLCNTVELYELVEQYMADDVIDKLRDSYKETMPIDGKMTLERNDFADGPYLQAVMSAMSKFAYRNLQSAEVDGDEQMSSLLKDTSLWPRGDIPKLISTQEKSNRSRDVYLLPPSLCVKHIYYTVKFVKERLEKLKESPPSENLKKKKTKGQKLKGWKK